MHHDAQKKSINSSVINMFKLLSSRSSQSSVTVEERSGKMRRKKEHRNKKIKRQKQRGKKQAYKVILKTHGKENAVFKDDNSSKIKLSAKKLKSIKLHPRFHLKSIQYLISIDVMDNLEQTKRLLEKMNPQ